MLLDEQEVTERMQSPMNLLNRLKSISSRNSSQSPSLPPTSEQVIKDINEKLAYGSIKTKAASIMVACMDELKTRIPEVTKPEKLAAIAAEMAKVVNAESKDSNRDMLDRPQFIVYAPQFNNENNYETIYSRE